jgi:DNA-binding transcriptional MerR regulator
MTDSQGMELENIAILVDLLNDLKVQQQELNQKQEEINNKLEEVTRRVKDITDRRGPI